jgi:hypothetical protein
MITGNTRLERWSWSHGCVLLVGIVLAFVAQAGTLSPAARVEIAALLNRLETSGCQFNRNGTWYAATDARAHLQRKLDYLENRGLVESAEQFIDRGASTSSMTGRAYLVRCGSEQPVESQAWLKTQLRALRAAAAPMPNP